MSLDQQDQIALIQAQLKDCDRDHYLAAIFSGKAYMKPLWALYAFNCELAKISHVVQEPMLGKMRLQWWREVIENAANENAANIVQEKQSFLGHPVADQLSRVISHYRLDKELLGQIVNAREADLDHDFLSSESAFNDYHDAIWGNLYRLAAQIMTREQGDSMVRSFDNPAFTTAGHLTGMIQFFRTASGQTLELHQKLYFQKKGESDTHFMGEDESDVTKKVAEYNGQQIEHIAKKFADFSQQLRSLPLEEDRFFLCLTLTPPYLGVWRKQAHAWPEGRREINPLRHFFTLWRAGKKGVRKHLKISEQSL